MKKLSPFRRIANFITGIFATLTRNWGLKFIALALAILVYYSLKQETNTKRNDRTFFQQTP